MKEAAISQYDVAIRKYTFSVPGLAATASTSATEAGKNLPVNHSRAARSFSSRRNS